MTGGAYARAVAYDEVLAARVRGVLPPGPVTEQRMFGGLAFLVGGNLAVTASSDGGLLVRVGPDAVEQLLATTGAAAVMGSRVMRGWVRLPAEAVGGEGALRQWVERGVAFAASLPPKPGAA